MPALPWKQYTGDGECGIGNNPFTCPLPDGATGCNYYYDEAS